MFGIIAVILVFGSLIFFHELGHFLAARSFGMGVKTFSLGFGPALLSFKRQKTVYQIAAVPLGGFVSLIGDSSDAEIPEEFSERESFHLRPAWQRFCVIAAGPLANLLLAWLICWGFMWAQGREYLPPVVGEILADSPAIESPLRVGDRILSIDGTPVAKWSQMPALVQRSEGEQLSITVERPDGTLLTFSLTPTRLTQTTADGKQTEVWGMGILAGETVHQEFGFAQSAWEGMVEAKNMVAMTWQALSDLVTRKVAFNNVGGPILIAQVIYHQADYGLMNVLMIAALFSVNLGVLNLLPIPVLDGGHLIFLSVEIAGRRPVSARVQEKAILVGSVLLIALMLSATFNDVMRFFS